MRPTASTKYGNVTERLHRYKRCTSMHETPSRASDLDRALDRVDLQLASVRHKQAMLKIWKTLLDKQDPLGVHELNFKCNMEKWYGMFEPADLDTFRSDAALALLSNNTDIQTSACEALEVINKNNKTSRKTRRILEPIPIKKTIQKTSHSPSATPSATPSRCSTPPPSIKSENDVPSTTYLTPHERARHIRTDAEL